MHRLKKEIIISLIFLVSYFLSTLGNAAPVVQKDLALTQADGQKFLARPFGDEWHNGYETEDGFTILFNKRTGNWVYADRAADGSLIKTEIEVGKGTPPTHKHLRPILREELDQMESQGIDLEESPVVPATGNQKVLVILVQFTNRALMTTEAQWADLIFNETTFSKLRHYFRQASYNNTDLIPALESYGTPNNGVIVVSLPYDHPNTAGNIDDTNRQITKDALIASDPYVDFASFDNDGNNYISTDELHIIIVVAGYEAAYGGTATACSPSVWSHTWCLFELTPLTLDGKKVAQCVSSGAYIQHGEWHCASWDNPGHMATMGIIAHEFGHSLGLPDEYDTDGSSNGIGKWGLMGSGNWNFCSGGLYGNCPSHPTAWDKWYLNWLMPSQVLATQTVDIPDITTSAVVYQLGDNPFGVDWSFQVTSGTGEYFLVENRQRTGYNAGVPGSGLLIWHVWEGVTSSNSANQNEAGRRLLDLREADGLNDLDAKANSGDAGDPYPGSSSNTVFDDLSNPSSRLYCSSGIGFCDQSYVSVTNISAPGSTMTATLSAETTPPARFEEDDPAISYTGTWRPYYHSACSGGTLLYSCQLGAKASFSFTGTGIKWIVAKDSRLGKARACLDGNCLYQLVDLYSPVTSYQLVLQKINLVPGPHTVTIEVSGQKNPSSKNYCVDVDAFEIVP